MKKINYHLQIATDFPLQSLNLQRTFRCKLATDFPLQLSVAKKIASMDLQRNTFIVKSIVNKYLQRSPYLFVTNTSVANHLIF